MATNTYMCEFCGEDFEVERGEEIVGDDIDGRGLTVYFCSEEHRRRYENGEEPL